MTENSVPGMESPPGTLCLVTVGLGPVAAIHPEGGVAVRPPLRNRPEVQADHSVPNMPADSSRPPGRG